MLNLNRLIVIANFYHVYFLVKCLEQNVHGFHIFNFIFAVFFSTFRHAEQLVCRSLHHFLSLYIYLWCEIPNCTYSMTFIYSHFPRSKWTGQTAVYKCPALSLSLSLSFSFSLSLVKVAFFERSFLSCLIVRNN